MSVHTRWYRLRRPDTAAIPVMLDLGYAGGVLAPADNGVFSFTFGVLGRDPALRGLRHDALFQQAAMSLPLVAPWVDPDVATPISGVRFLGGLRNRLNRLAVAETPLTSGVVCTNPRFGRGVSLALVHAAALADVLDEHDAPVTVATAFAGATQRELEPWYHDAVSDDEVRRLIAERIRDGEPLSSIGTGGDGPAVRFARATPFAVQRDPGGARRLSPDPEPPRPTVGVHREPRDPGSGRGVWRAIEHDPPSPPGPSYPEFVRTLGAAEAAAGRRQPPV